jgi:hypothetical protein
MRPAEAGKAVDELAITPPVTQLASTADLVVDSCSNSEPVTIRAAIGAPISTDSESVADGPGTTGVMHLDEPVTVHSPTSGPVPMTVGWLTDAEAKVIEPPSRPP